MRMCNYSGRHRGTERQRHKVAKAQRHRGTEAQSDKGTKKHELAKINDFS